MTKYDPAKQDYGPLGFKTLYAARAITFAHLIIQVLYLLGAIIEFAEAETLQQRLFAVGYYCLYAVATRLAFELAAVLFQIHDELKQSRQYLATMAAAANTTPATTPTPKPATAPPTPDNKSATRVLTQADIDRL